MNNNKNTKRDQRSSRPNKEAAKPQKRGAAKDGFGAKKEQKELAQLIKTPPAKTIENGEKAYNVLAKQLGVSVGKAKDMIDRGLVYLAGKKVLIARATVPADAQFKVEKLLKPRVIFENDDMLAVDKPPFMNSDEVAAMFGATLAHRLDKETSGVLVLAKTEEYLALAIAAFKKREVYKEYVAIVQGVIAEGGIVDVPLLIKKGQRAQAVVDKKLGKSAKTIYEPLEMMAKKTKLKVIIETGRTHQIRAHMKFLKHPILGDTAYGGAEAKRMMLHSKTIRLLGKEFNAEEPKEFALRE